jgi:hypothetical protein
MGLVLQQTVQVISARDGWLCAKQTMPELSLLLFLARLCWLLLNSEISFHSPPTAQRYWLLRLLAIVHTCWMKEVAVVDADVRMCCGR